MADADEFTMPFQRLLTEWAWGTRGAGQDSIVAPAAC
jgi:hypothetical protein